jgi:hypothetical protein
MASKPASHAPFGVWGAFFFSPALLRATSAGVWMFHFSTLMFGYSARPIDEEKSLPKIIGAGRRRTGPDKRRILIRNTLTR